jgi:hypothetical protein
VTGIKDIDKLDEFADAVLIALRKMLLLMSVMVLTRESYFRP